MIRNLASFLFAACFLSVVCVPDLLPGQSVAARSDLVNTVQADAGAAQVEEAEHEKLNVLFIMADDLGKEWISCYGAEGIETPSIDQLAQTGIRFDNFYVMPQCTPTRLSLLTCTYPFRHGWVNHWDVPRWGGGCSFDPDLNRSFPAELQQAGIATAAAGKWQIDDFRQEPDAMVRAGFNEYCMWTGYEAGNPPSGERYADPYVYSDGVSGTREGEFGPDVYCDFLIDFIGRHKDEQMFLYFPMALPHGPLVPTPDEPDVKDKMDKHRAMVRYVDKLVGRLVQALDDNGIRERTVVIFTTDNGTGRGLTGSIQGRPVQGGKAQTTENGICVPMVVSCPGVVSAGVESKALADITDIGPTCLDLAGLESERADPFSGVSFAEVLRGNSERSRRNWIFSMGGGNNAKLTDAGVENQFWYRDRVIRNERFKLFIGPDGQPEKLVDVESDPFEETDMLGIDDEHCKAITSYFMSVIESMPERDADPQYTPLEHRPWFREVQVESETWKTGYDPAGGEPDR